MADTSEKESFDPVAMKAVLEKAKACRETAGLLRDEVAATPNYIKTSPAQPNHWETIRETIKQFVRPRDELIDTVESVTGKNLDAFTGRNSDALNKRADGMANTYYHQCLDQTLRPADVPNVKPAEKGLVTP